MKKILPTTDKKCCWLETAAAMMIFRKKQRGIHPAAHLSGRTGS